MEKTLYIIYNNLLDTKVYTTFNEIMALNKMIVAENRKSLSLLRIDTETLLDGINYLCYDLDREQTLKHAKSLDEAYKYVAIRAMDGFYLGDTKIIKIDKEEIINEIEKRQRREILWQKTMF